MMLTSRQGFYNGGGPLNHAGGGVAHHMGGGGGGVGGGVGLGPNGGGGGALQIQPMGVFRHIPHSAPVDHAAVTSYHFSSCGLHGVSASRDRTLRLYDVGAVMLRDAFIVAQGGCERATFTHSSDVVAFTPSHKKESHVYFMSLSTGKIISGIADVVGGCGAMAAAPTVATTSSSSSSSANATASTASSTTISGYGMRAQLAKEFPNAMAFKDGYGGHHHRGGGRADDGSTTATPSASSSPSVAPQLTLIPTAASTCLALHPTTDIMVSVRKDGWAQLCVPSVGRPLALLRPTEGDEGYASRRRARIGMCQMYGGGGATFADYHHHGGGNAAAAAAAGTRGGGAANAGPSSADALASPSDDGEFDFGGYYGTAVSGSGGAPSGGPSGAPFLSNYQLSSASRGHSSPMVTTVHFDYDGDHPTSTAAFSPCGNVVAVGRSTSVSLYDMRALARGPTRTLSSATLFTSRGRFEHEPPTRDKDTPVVSGVQLAAGGLLLATSTLGHSTLVDAVGVYDGECDYNGGVRVLAQYSGGGYPSQFFASGRDELASSLQGGGAMGMGMGMGGLLSASSPYSMMMGGGSSEWFSSPFGGGGAGGGANASSLSTAFAYPSPPSCGAMFLTPSEGHASMVLQPTTRRQQSAGSASSSYSLLLYEGFGSAGAKLLADHGLHDGAASSAACPTAAADAPSPLAHFSPAGTSPSVAVLTHQLVPRDAGPTRVVAVNPRFGIIASAANTVQWWAIGDTPSVEEEHHGEQW